MTEIEIRKFIDAQLQQWPQASLRHESLKNVETRAVSAFGHPFSLQFNPARAVSTTAKVDAASIAARPCFLCGANRPKEQIGLPMPGGFTLLVNPFPIFPDHLVIASDVHIAQSLKGDAAVLMREFSRLLPGFTLIFNGSKAGASAPDHLHFQAVPSRYVTVPEWCFTYELPDGTDLDETDDTMINAICHDGKITVIPRRRHRPKCYGDVLVSPASLDLGGTLITVRREDFDSIDSEKLEEILADVTFRRPQVEVGIVAAANPQITPLPSGLTQVSGVTIGVGFHWQRQQTQTFAGEVEVRELASGLKCVVNRLDVEEYLRSVIASEMSATSDLELLKAHAIISRSWLMAQLRVTRALAAKGAEVDEPDVAQGHEEIVKWYDRDDHVDFDVCADDHCQRYQGVTRISSPYVDQAVKETEGMVLMDSTGHIADTRFSKCCGGITELFENCWQPRHHSYLTAVECPWCGKTTPEALRQVLNDFDHETTPDFYHWTVKYSALQLSELVKRRSGIDFGMITALTPLHRGPSGRITRLMIEGTKRSVVVGKELEIRKWLSETHLRSSAFSVERTASGDFILNGKGWGHGVGLCQIGAAMMANTGHTYREILSLYFPNTSVATVGAEAALRGGPEAGVGEG